MSAGKLKYSEVLMNDLADELQNLYDPGNSRGLYPDGGSSVRISRFIMELLVRIEELEAQVKYLTSEDRFSKGLPI